MKSIFKLSISFFVLLGILILSSCDLTSSHPQVRFRESGSPYDFVCLGVVSGSTYQTVSGWFHAENSITSYVNVTEGDYVIVYDNDDDHSLAAGYFSTVYTLENGKKYTIDFNSSTGSIIED